MHRAAISTSRLRRSDTLRRYTQSSDATLRRSETTATALVEGIGAINKLDCNDEDQHCDLQLSTVQMMMVRRHWRSIRSSNMVEPGLSVLKAVMLRSDAIQIMFDQATSNRIIRALGMKRQYGASTSEEDRNAVRGSCDSLYYDALADEDDLRFLNMSLTTRNFEFYRSSETENLLIEHAVRLTNLYDFMVEHCLDKPGRVRGLCRKIGAAHASLRGNGFHASFWNVLSESMLQRICTWDWFRRCSELYKAWVDIVFYIIRNMRDGYIDKVQEKRRTEMKPSKPFFCMPRSASDQPPETEKNTEHRKRRSPLKLRSELFGFRNLAHGVVLQVQRFTRNRQNETAQKTRKKLSAKKSA